MRDDRQRILDILEAIDRIEKYAHRGRSAFDSDELIQSWIVRHLQIIGEAARALSPATHDLDPTIPWSKIIGMRHILVHDYFGIDTQIVWTVVESDLSQLKKQMQAILKQIPT